MPRQRPTAPETVRSHSPARGRYSRRELRDARVPANGVGSRPTSRRVSLALVAIADPFDPAVKLQATVNRRVDILEQEHAHNHITEAAYATGRKMQAVFEQAGAGLGSSWGGGDGTRKVGGSAHEMAIGRRVEAAKAVTVMMAQVERLVGMVGARFLRQVIAEGATFASYAAARGKSGDRAVAQVAAHFRLLLEGLAESWDEGRIRPKR